MTLRTTRDVLFANPAIKPGKTAVIFEGHRVSYDELRRRVAAIAHALCREGVRFGDRVAVLLGNQPEFLECYYAITGIGAVFVPLNWRLHPSEHVALLNSAEAVLLIAGSEFAKSALAVRDSVPSVRRVISVGEGQPTLPQLENWITAIDGTHGDASDLPAGPQPRPEDWAALVFTSGTTSQPKGVMLSHRNYMADIENVAHAFKPDRDSINLQLTPIYHASNVFSLMHLAHGATTILERGFEPDRTLALVQRYRVTFFFAVPTMLYRMLDLPDRDGYDISSLKLLSYGAAPITGGRLVQVLEFFGPRVCHSYGLTETTSHSSILLAADQMRAEGSIGKGLKGAELRVVDELGQDVGTDEIGELIVRGDNIMLGYFNMPEETGRIIADGWLHTGDLARSDAKGFVYIVDRKKDIVISGGVNIYPREIEDVISKHPAVADVAVYGIPDDDWGESLVAAVVIRPGGHLDADGVSHMCRERLGRYKVPKHVAFVTELPKNAAGKTLKNLLRERWQCED